MTGRAFRPSPGEIPESAGVYRFRDAHGRVIYVGKAKNLRSRLNSYFGDLRAMHPRTAQMVTAARDLDWTVVRNEVEALQLEYSWIKEFDPRFNVKYRDDKSYPYLAVTMGDEVPRVQVMRGAKRPGTRYFGPYGHAWAIRETVDLLLRVFPVRTCSTGVYRRQARTGTPCLLGYIDKCSAPCVGQISIEEHRRLAEGFCEFLAGDSGRLERDLERRMKQAAAELDFEQAARLRDDLDAVRKALSRNAVVFTDSTDADVFGLAVDELEAAAQVFRVRGGRIRGQRGWVVERETADQGELVATLLQQVYGDDDALDLPREVLVPQLPNDADQLTGWLDQRRGARVAIRVPQRGDKKTLLETVTRNAEQALALHKTRRAGDLTTRSQALSELQEALDLAEAPLRIECFDVSNLQGTDVVASMVVFEDGLPRKSEYRRFAIKGPATDDLASMSEVIRRRFARYLQDRERAADPQAGQTESAKFAYPPNLVVVDGGAPQVGAAATAMAELGIVDVALCGLAKRLEEVWLPGQDYPVVLGRSSQGLYLLQRVRDEAHRFAIAFHRQRRSKRMTRSALDDVPGLGERRRAALMQRFKTVKALRAAGVDELQQVEGIGPRLAEAIVTHLSGAEPSVDMATGELLD